MRLIQGKVRSGTSTLLVKLALKDEKAYVILPEGIPSPTVELLKRGAKKLAGISVGKRINKDTLIGIVDMYNAKNIYIDNVSTMLDPSDIEKIERKMGIKVTITHQLSQTSPDHVELVDSESRKVLKKLTAEEILAM